MFGQWRTASTRKTTDLFLYAIVFAFCLQALVSAEAANDVPSAKSLDDNPESDNEYSKRGWKTDLPMWGKRGWSNLHPGWGKRESDLDEELSYGSPVFDKRAWQRLQGGWGKRFIPTEEDMVIRQLAAALEENDSDNTIDYYPERDFDRHDVDKRNWNKFTDGWGKRSNNNNKWDKFRGSWGKREPAWNNLKGLWGKRSSAE